MLSTLPVTINAESLVSPNQTVPTESITTLNATVSTEPVSLYAISFYSDSCENCKQLDPKIDAARMQANLDNKTVLFVKLNLTDAKSSAQSRLMAEVLGILEFYTENNGQTGFVLLVDAKDKKIHSTLTQEQNVDDIITDIEFYL